MHTERLCLSCRQSQRLIFDPFNRLSRSQALPGSRIRRGSASRVAKAGDSYLTLLIVYLVPRLCLGMHTERLCLSCHQSRRLIYNSTFISFPGSAWECIRRGSASRVTKAGDSYLTLLIVYLVPRLCLGMHTERLCLSCRQSRRLIDNSTFISFPGSAWECIRRGSASRVTKAGDSYITPVFSRSQALPGNAYGEALPLVSPKPETHI